MPTLADALRGYTPPTESALADPIVEHFRTLPQQLATNQQAMDNTMASMYKTDLGTGQPNPNYRPEAMNEFTQMMPMVGALTAWHGTPHKILGKFDISKVGTGEGAQAYGHGMYFAENPAVAKEYADMDTKMANVFLKSNNNDVLKALDDAEQQLNAAKQSKSSKSTIEQSQRTVDYIKDMFGSNKQPTGNLYKVDIPDEHIPNMLDWDKPLSQQSDVVRQALGLPEDKFAGFKVPATGTNYSFSPNMRGAEFYKELTDLAKTQSGASEILNSMGVKGIRYLDQGSRTPGFSSLTPTQLESRIQSLQADIKSGGGNTQKMKDQLKGLQNELDSYKNMTSNFVVFDPSTVKILEENNKPTRKELIQQQIDKIE